MTVRSHSRRPSPSLVISLLALLVAASGTAVAASHLANGDRLIAKHSLSGDRLRAHTLSAAQIDVRRLGVVPLAAAARLATSAAHASTADTAASAAHASTADTAASAAQASTADTAASAAQASTADTAASAAQASTADTAAALTAPEPVHHVGAAGEPPFENGWQNVSGSIYEPVGFYKDAGGVVHLTGIANGGMPSSRVFHLPPGYRPATNKLIRVAAECNCAYTLFDPQGGTIQIPLTTSGVVIYGPGFGAGIDGAVGADSNVEFPSGGGGWLSFDGISLRAAS
jgi:hypothetical protein